MDRLNIVFVMTDDHGPWAVRAAGCSAVNTPAMDWLAQTGCRFSRAATPSPVCSPARACFFTGMIPSAHGIHDWIEERDFQNKDWFAGRTTLAQRLQSAGYDTALVGKWHCGRSHLPQPGFNHWFSYAKGHQFSHVGEQCFVSDGRIVSEVGRQSRFFFENARSWLRSRQSTQPFFLFYGPVDTHSPFTDHAQPTVNAMRQANLSSVLYEPDRYPPERRALAFPATDNERREHLAQYLAAVACVDAQLGGIIDTLEELGSLDNTLIVYTSDHGHMNGQHGLVGKGNASMPQNFYDESIYVPSFARLPGLIPANVTIDVPVDHCDWFATLLHLANAQIPDQECLGPGRSMVPLWREANPEWRHEQICEYGNARMIRTATRKLVLRNPVENRCYPDEFYDLKEDPREVENRVDQPRYAREIAEMKAQLRAHFERWEIPEHSGWDAIRLPRFNPEEAWHVDADIPPPAALSPRPSAPAT